MPSDRPSSAPETPETVPSTGQDDATSLFRALGSRNYRLFFAGQAVSLTGFWMQKVATGWLVYRLTRSPLALGVVASLVLPEKEPVAIDDESTR